MGDFLTMLCWVGVLYVAYKLYKVRTTPKDYGPTITILGTTFSRMPSGWYIDPKHELMFATINGTNSYAIYPAIPLNQYQFVSSLEKTTRDQWIQELRDQWIQELREQLEKEKTEITKNTSETTT